MSKTDDSLLPRCPDMTKTIKLIGYKSKVGLPKGVSMTYDWYKVNIFEGNERCAR
jgi:nucleoside-diphosphate-sugar epimerase